MPTKPPGTKTPSLKKVLAELKALGTAQNVKIYGRHGVTDPMFGVSYGNQSKLAKSLGTNHDLALQLWDSGNHDARILAMKIADPAQASRSVLDSWVRATDNYVLSDALGAYVATTAHRDSRADKWAPSSREFTAHTGWNLVAAQLNDDTLTNDYFADRLKQIEAGIHAAPNRTRHAMMMTLVSIGGTRKGLRRSAVAAAKRIGPVDVDHGQTNCTTPEPIGYIDNMWAHHAKMAERAAERAAKKASAKPSVKASAKPSVKASAKPSVKAAPKKRRK